MDLRRLHRKTAPILFIPFLLMALTGVIYQIGTSWFGLSNELGSFMMDIHEGKFLGGKLVPVYVLLVGVGLLGMLVTGVVMIKNQRKALQANAKRNVRWFHHLLALIFFLPLLISASTGVAFRVGKAWFGLPARPASILINLHQGAYLGSTLQSIYVLLVGAGLIGLVITGIQMTRTFRKRNLQAPTNS
ncbi:MAG TPA: PepSY domain-containing protein [Leptolyngbyaceae cyanobacterium M33_DOE_097]|uniref:PepSY domain-containing protein n=1 Tax=Oscillatoriales cyanobacterium SpSt-418 TaxID=2282169 RepID=A0A7C3PGN6_9CYAN|nr:PepSY domain-containing protein [Leptolyngbyaceae cyanobacterium M33_DOE_097]